LVQVQPEEQKFANPANFFYFSPLDCYGRNKAIRIAYGIYVPDELQKPIPKIYKEAI
jgi:hypothetical protein